MVYNLSTNPRNAIQKYLFYLKFERKKSTTLSSLRLAFNFDFEASLTISLFIYFKGYQKNKQFIATQGPKYNTLNDFWEMVWKEDSSVIVMLCNCVEKEKVVLLYIHTNERIKKFYLSYEL